MEQRFQFAIGIAFSILLSVEESHGASEASCSTYISEWGWNFERQNLTTCFPDITYVNDEDFRISYALDQTTLGIDFEKKENIKFLPTNLFRVFPELVAMKVWFCSVISVNDNNFKGLSKLEYLSLPSNKIENVSCDAFVDLVSLVHLDLGYNRIRLLAKNTFDSLKALQALYLNKNEIQNLHPEIFSKLMNVEYLNLSENQLISLDGSIFESLTNLKVIYLKINKLEKIQNDFFKNNLNLTDIHLQGNKIKFIDATAFNHLTNLRRVDLRQNLCSDETYYVFDFDSMREDIKRNCSDDPTIRDITSFKKNAEIKP